MTIYNMQEHFILADSIKRQFVQKLNQRQDKYTWNEKSRFPGAG